MFWERAAGPRGFLRDVLPGMLGQDLVDERLIADVPAAGCFRNCSSTPASTRMAMSREPISQGVFDSDVRGPLARRHHALSRAVGQHAVDVEVARADHEVDVDHAAVAARG